MHGPEARPRRLRAGRLRPGGPVFKSAASGPEAGRRRRMRRGNVRAAILLLLEEEPRNGYQVMQEIEQRSEGAWRPSPGSVYPAFQLLADEGLIRGEARDGGNVFELTDAGRTYVEENREQLGNPWQQAGEGMPDGVRELIHLAMQVGDRDPPGDPPRQRGPAGRGGEGARPTPGGRSTASSPRTSRPRARAAAAWAPASTGAMRRAARPPVGDTGRCRRPASARLQRRLPGRAAGRDFLLLWIALARRGLRHADDRGRDRLAGLRDQPLGVRPRPDRAREFVPLLLLALPAGQLADRLPRRLVLRGRARARRRRRAAAARRHASHGANQLWPFLVLAAANGVAAAIANPCRARARPDARPAASCSPSAMALRSIAFQIGDGRRARRSAGSSSRSAPSSSTSARPMLLVVGRRSPARDPRAATSVRSGDTVARTLAACSPGSASSDGRPVMLGAITLDLFAVLFGGAVALLPLFAKQILHTGPARPRHPAQRARRRRARSRRSMLARRPLARRTRADAARRRRRLRRRDDRLRPLDARSRSRSPRSRSAGSST